ncbi:hypothetical protein ScPMuIL_015349 [Solemya velum]
MTQVDCRRWIDCCYAATECCDKQRITPVPPTSGPMCEQTWDGWSCWAYTQAGQNVSGICPTFIPYSQPEAHSWKFCTKNGTWWRDPKTDQEWTDYRGCVPYDLEVERKSIIAGVVLNIIGVSMLIPSVVIYIYFRSLRRQLRIRLHINLFASLVVSGLTFILWDIMVHYNRLVHSSDKSLMYSDPIGCKVLNTLSRFGRTAASFWMLCEGFHLHRLMANAFLYQTNIKGYLLFGWGGPTLTTALYVVLRKTLADVGPAK